MREKYKETCKYLNYVEHFLLLASAANVCVPISAFVSLVVVPVGVSSSAVGLKICAIKYRLIIKKKRKKHDKIVLLGKAKLYTIEVWISKALTDSSISYDEFVSVSNVLREYNEIKEEIKNPKTFVEYTI